MHTHPAHPPCLRAWANGSRARTHDDVREADAYLGEYSGDVVKVHVVEVDGVDAAGRLEAPAAVERVHRPRPVQLQRVALDLRQTLGRGSARRVAAQYIPRDFTEIKQK